MPVLVILDENGKVLNTEGVDVIKEYGADGYPFTSEKVDKLKQQDEEVRGNQSLKSLLVSGSRDFVLTSDGEKVSVTNLVIRNLFLYFSADSCDSCRDFLPKLLEAYYEFNKEGNALTIIFISSVEDQKSFDENFAKMPWLAIPFCDEREDSLSCLFKVRLIPTVVAIGQDGKIVSTEAYDRIMRHGPKAFPFTKELIKEMEEIEWVWPEKVNHAPHDRELVLSNRVFLKCDGCGEEERRWSYYCEDCDAYLHAKCALKGRKEKGGGN